MDEESFKELLKDQIPWLKLHARALVYNYHNAEDLVQNTLERALKKRHLYSSDLSIKGWLKVMMGNIRVNTLKQKIMNEKTIIETNSNAVANSTFYAENKVLASEYLSMMYSKSISKMAKEIGVKKSTWYKRLKNIENLNF